ncbi:MAG: hypothetical protein RIF42_07985 [Parvibaculaceae bacterium]|uniref:hypothetical protein n=1 Tax=Marinovum algicola TaxID=42444 RepID=UPI0032F802AA
MILEIFVLGIDCQSDLLGLLAVNTNTPAGMSRRRLLLAQAWIALRQVHTASSHVIALSCPSSEGFEGTFGASP